jgi:hypothetical protein
MSNFTVAQVEADVNYLMSSLDTNKRLIPSVAVLLRKSSFIPLLTILLSFISTAVFYFGSSWNEKTLDGFLHFFLTEGWVVVAPTIIIGAIFTLFTYNKLMMYLTVSDDVRSKSVILTHLQKLTVRIVKVFMLMMLVSVMLASTSPLFTFAIPVILLAMLFAIGLIVGAEINRLGTGLALEKISNLIKSI